MENNNFVALPYAVENGHGKQILIIGAGSIVTDAHLPAYKLANFKVAAIFDIHYEKALQVAEQFQIPKVCRTIEELIALHTHTSIFDIAVPGNAIAGILEKLPNRSYALIQKPMGENLQEAKEILRITQTKSLVCGVNFQLRYAPYVDYARKLINNNIIGDICSFNINIDVYTPWHTWSFLNNIPRVEILYHSIHYVDLIRSFLGNPTKAYAKSTKHFLAEHLASVRTNMILDYGEWIAANIITQHSNRYGLDKQDASITIEGTKGIIKMRLGSLMNYPEGVADKFEYAIWKEDGPIVWQQVDIEGSWFPHAFIGSMLQLMKTMNKTIERPNNSVQDCIYTMATVEAAYKSSNEGGKHLEI
ncbi:Gfo/Idh/MocA family protein [Polluticaenibacter yanchengensis]|uniref:Gfo/Idh/MocA family oxidoreductase n=1 Tax=Polluticaenibacter yanchengensis TaxID=3014562 RepID=A0ABT4UGH4_9BACT|nr:Gfo/Idh/MocA family oxidoreductase [Chitinophagaceae bacterium LY-5]